MYLLPLKEIGPDTFHNSDIETATVVRQIDKEYGPYNILNYYITEDHIKDTHP
jgi:hypothetical protein